jgi:hypothetical protein
VADNAAVFGVVGVDPDKPVTAAARERRVVHRFLRRTAALGPRRRPANAYDTPDARPGGRRVRSRPGPARRAPQCSTPSPSPVSTRSAAAARPVRRSHASGASRTSRTHGRHEDRGRSCGPPIPSVHRSARRRRRGHRAPRYRPRLLAREPAGPPCGVLHHGLTATRRPRVSHGATPAPHRDQLTTAQLAGLRRPRIPAITVPMGYTRECFPPGCSSSEDRGRRPLPARVRVRAGHPPPASPHQRHRSGGPADR